MFSDWRHRLRAVFRRATVEREIDEELRYHVDRHVDALLAKGLDPAEARRQARFAFGGLDRMKEEYRDSLGTRLLDDLWRDVRLACRLLGATPSVTMAAVASLALGIGANAAIFSIVDAVLVRQLPVRDPASLALLTDNATSVRVWSHPVWMQIRERRDLFAGSAASSFTRFNLASGGETAFVDGLWASGSFFETLDVEPLLGRMFSEADDRPGGGPDGPVVVISPDFWRRRFGGAPDVVGRSLILDDVRFTVVGVTPPAFGGVEVGRTFDVVVPLANEPVVRSDSFLHGSATFLNVIVRRKPGQSVEAATAALRGVQAQIREATLGELDRFSSRAAIDRYLTAPFVLVAGDTGYSGARDLRGNYRRPLQTILVVVGLLLLIACVNVANLLTARAIARRHELSLRLALGASRWRLVRQVLAESVVLYGLGAMLGLWLATWAGRLLVTHLSAPADPIALDLTIDARLLAFTVAVTAITTVLFGTVPALRASRATPMDALKHQGRSVRGQALGATAGGLIVVQVALSLVLVSAAGAFLRTFTSLNATPLGFDPEQVVALTLDAHRTAKEAAERITMYERARDAVLQVPDVADAALSLTTPLGVGVFTPLVSIDGVADTRGPVWANLTSPGYLATFRTPLVAGRDLAESDRAGAPRVALVNETFVQKFAAGGHVLGTTFTLYAGTPRELGPIEIVGVVGDAVYGSRRAAAPPTYYLPLAQFDHLGELGIRSINLSVRAASGSPMRLTRSLADAIATAHPQLAVTPHPLRAQVEASLVRERVMAWLAGFFGALALLLSGLGLYGVTSYGVTSRRTEIGIRLALGASPLHAIRPVLMRTAVFVGLGVLLGVMMSVWAARLVEGLLYEVDPRHPLMLVASVLVLSIVAGLAAWLPAHRAGRIDPIAVLRET